MWLCRLYTLSFCLSNSALSSPFFLWRSLLTNWLSWFYLLSFWMSFSRSAYLTFSSSNCWLMALDSIWRSLICYDMNVLSCSSWEHILYKLSWLFSIFEAIALWLLISISCLSFCSSISRMALCASSSWWVRWSMCLSRVFISAM